MLVLSIFRLLLGFALLSPSVFLSGLDPLLTFGLWGVYCIYDFLNSVGTEILVNYFTEKNDGNNPTRS